MLFRSLFVLATVAGVFGQATNTNAAINDIISKLDEQVHVNIPNILTMQANHTASDGTIGTQVNQLITAFTTVSTNLANTPVSSGSTTVAPTNDDISIIFSDAMQQVASGLSGLTTTVVPTFTSMISRLDPAVAGAINQYNITLPGAAHLIHTMMLDAQQFLVKEGAWPQTLAALDFPATTA